MSGDMLTLYVAGAGIVLSIVTYWFGWDNGKLEGRQDLLLEIKQAVKDQDWSNQSEDLANLVLEWDLAGWDRGYSSGYRDGKNNRRRLDKYLEGKI